MRILLIAAAAAILATAPAQAGKWIESACYELYEAGKSSHGTQYRARLNCKFDAAKFWAQFSDGGHGSPADQKN
jgi:hypothetical protein